MSTLRKAIGRRFSRHEKQTSPLAKVFTRFARASALATLVAASATSGCLNQPTGGTSTTSSRSVSGSSSKSSSSSTSSSGDTQCTVFANNSNDYNNCLACKTRMCPCTEYYTDPGRSSECYRADLASCTIPLNTLAQCVHDSVGAGGGNCSGLRCGDGQVADFASCVCRDANPPSSIGAQPGQGDQSSPYLELGLTITQRYCPPDINTTGHYKADCLLYDSGSGNSNAMVSITSHSGTPPRWMQAPPTNVYQDLGYLRWDLALDASQYSPILPLNKGQAYLGSWSTIPLQHSLYYQLKPGTRLPSGDGTKVRWNDCAEHFSAYTSGTTTYVNSNNACTLSVAPTGKEGATDAATISLSQTSATTGVAYQSEVSANGPAANRNITSLSRLANPKLRLADTTATPPQKLGLAKSSVNAAGGTTVWPVTAEYLSGLATPRGTGLFSNIGTYKYTWGPVRVESTSAPAGTDVASTTVTGRISLNVNLGFNPASIVESTAMSPEAALGQVATRDCSSSAITQNTCVLTAVYRTSGGGILSQTFSPVYTATRDASPISALPAGVIAASTPKIIEDTSQFDLNSTLELTRPAKLRTFVRGTDGNVHMSRFEAGRWYNWVNLGRPWLCGTSAACNNLRNTPSTTPLVRAPFGFTPTGAAAAAWPISAVDGETAGDLSGFSGQMNDGISIAGEPVVVSLMDNYNAQRYGRGIIGIFVRVSHLNSSKGWPGRWHNAVFYTFAVAGGARSAGDSWHFDKLSAWSQWMPVMGDQANGPSTIFRIQGNPTVFARRSPSNDVYRFYIFGTRMVDVGGNKMLHPPIAADMSTAVYTAAAPPAGIYQDTFSTYEVRNWYNYGHELWRGSLDISAYAGAAPAYSVTPTNFVTYSNPPLAWTNFANAMTYDRTTSSSQSTDMQAGNLMGAVVSDWSYAPLDPSTTLSTAGNRVGEGSRVRLFASALGDHTCDETNAFEGASHQGPLSPCRYDRVTTFMEFELDDAFTSGIRYRCRGFYSKLKFLGTPYPINLGDIIDNSSSQVAAPAGFFHNRSFSNREMKLFVFGRAPCEDPTRCDSVNPLVSYGAVQASATTNCNGTDGGLTDATMDIATHVVYYPGVAHVSQVTNPPVANLDFATSSSTQVIQNTYATSDVIPVFSNARFRLDNDAPIYIFTRDATGRLAHGRFESFRKGTGGFPFWVIFTTGGFVN